MRVAYVNYPNPHVTIHGDDGCATIQQQHKKGQWIVHLNVRTISTELTRFSEKHYRFWADSESNDLWIYADFGDAAFERVLIEHIRSVLASHYSPFGRVRTTQHCG